MTQNWRVELVGRKEKKKTSLSSRRRWHGTLLLQKATSVIFTHISFIFVSENDF